MNWKRIGLVILVVFLLLGCQSDKPKDKGHDETVKLVRDFYIAVYAKDYETAIVDLSCLGQEQTNFQMGPAEASIMQQAYPWQNIKLSQVEELDYSESIAHMQLTFGEGDNTRQEGITLKKVNNTWCVDILQTLSPYME